MTNRAVELDTYIVSRKPVFDWPTANCCHFVGAWVGIQRGRDPMEGLPPTPTQWAAQRLIVELGGDLKGVWDRFMGAASIPATLARIGDVVLVPLPGGPAIGICEGKHALLVQETGALIRVGMQEAICAWRVEVAC